MNDIILLSAMHMFLLYPVVFVFFFLPPCQETASLFPFYVMNGLSDIVWLSLLLLFLDRSISLSIKSLVLYYYDRVPTRTTIMYSIPKEADKEATVDKEATATGENETTEAQPSSASDTEKKDSGSEISSIGSTQSTVERSEE